MPIDQGESRRSREPQLPPPPNRVFPVRAWADLVGISYAQAKSLIRSGKGPRVVQLSERRIGITERDHDAWLAARTRPILKIVALVAVLVALAAPAICEPAIDGCLLALKHTDAFTDLDVNAPVLCHVVEATVTSTASKAGAQNTAKLRAMLCVTMMQNLWIQEHAREDRTRAPIEKFTQGCEMMFSGVPS
jgi:hypothetical protein